MFDPLVTDPRFDGASGDLNYGMFRKAYSFLEDYEDKEIEALKVMSSN